MVKLLQCQEDLAYSKLDRDELELFAKALVCSLLDTFESDLSTEELLEIERFCNDWKKE